MKPLGIVFALNEDVDPVLRVRRPTPAEDAVWQAVEAAIDEGWTPERYRNEAAEAWCGRLAEDAKHARAALAGAGGAR